MSLSSLRFPNEETLTKCLFKHVNHEFSSRRIYQEEEILEKVAAVAGKEFANTFSSRGIVFFRASSIVDDLVNGSGIGRLFPRVPFINPKLNSSFVESVEFVRFIERALIHCSKT